MRDNLKRCKTSQELKKLFEVFVDKVEVFEDYVIIALNIFYILEISSDFKTEEIQQKPPLEVNQVGVWRGGGEGNRTPVHTSIHNNFSECSLCFIIPFDKLPQTGFYLQ